MRDKKTAGSDRYEAIASDDIWDGFPGWLASEDPLANEALDVLVAEVAAPPESSARARLLAAMHLEGRFTRFAKTVGKMLDLTEEGAQRLLDQLHDPDVWDAGPMAGPWSTWWVDGGPRTERAIRGFFRMNAGTDFPHHAHLGEETVLVLQGSFTDTAGVRVGAGMLARMPAGSDHDFKVTTDGPDLLLLTVIEEGLEIIGGPVIRFDDREG